MYSQARYQGLQYGPGAATALHSAVCHVSGRYTNGNIYLINLNAIVSLSGWFPCSSGNMRRAASLPLFLCHGRGDDVVAYELGEKFTGALSAAGFRNLIFKSYNRREL
ncbi:hypothetical protein HN51_024380 [Arachis hypogaea]